MMRLPWIHPEPVQRAAIGVHDDGESLHGALMRREHGALALTGRASRHYGNAEQRRTAWESLVREFNEEAEEAIAVWTLPLGTVLHRALELPPTDDTALAKMITVQLDTLLPGQRDQFRWGWARAAHEAPVWVTAVRGAACVETAETGDGDLSSAFVSPAVAAAAWRHTDHATRGITGATSIMIDTRDTQTGVTVIGPAGLIATRTIDVGHDDLGGAQPGAWSTELAETLATLANECDLHDATVSTLGRAPSPDVLGALAERFDLRPEAVGADAHPLAAGAAASWLGETWPVIGGGVDVARQGGGAVNRRPFWIAAGWLLAALVALALIDLRAAQRVKAADTTYPDLAEQSGALQQELALARHLEARGPTLLAIVDEMTSLNGAFPTTLRYDADGRLELRGKLDSPGSIDGFVTQLATARTLRAVQLRNQKSVGDDQYEYDVQATPTEPFFEAFAVMPAIQPQENAGEPEDIQTADAGGEAPSDIPVSDVTAP